MIQPSTTRIPSRPPHSATLPDSDLPDSDLPDDRPCDASFASLLDMVRDQLLLRRAELIAAWLDDDHDQARRAAHKIHGSVGSFGMLRAGEAARRLCVAIDHDASEKQIQDALATLLAVIDPKLVAAHPAAHPAAARSHESRSPESRSPESSDLVRHTQPPVMRKQEQS